MRLVGLMFSNYPITAHDVETIKIVTEILKILFQKLYGGNYNCLALSESTP